VEADQQVSAATGERIPEEAGRIPEEGARTPEEEEGSHQKKEEEDEARTDLQQEQHPIPIREKKRKKFEHS